MHAWPLERDVIIVFQLGKNVVRAQHRVFRNLFQAVCAVGKNIGQRADMHAELADETFQAFTSRHEVEALRDLFAAAQPLAA